MKRAARISKRLLRALTSLAPLVLIASCAIPGSRASGGDEHVWLLALDAGPVAAAPGTCPVLRVALPRAAPGYGSSRMAYRQDPLRLEYFVSHRWADAPAQMLEPIMVGDLERTGRFREVVGADVRARAGLLLETDDLRLEQLFDKAGSRIRLSARLSLVDLSGQRVLGTREIAVTEPASAASPQAGVEAANRALPRFLGEVRRMLDADLPTGPGPCADAP